MPTGKAYEGEGITVYYDGKRCRHFAVADDNVEQPDAPTTIEVRADGPVMMRGDLTLAGPEGPVKETRAAVCGCGKTSNAPFCDGACGCSP
ncbi:MAG: CDGSH iron-sulfur domain-containing protein [Actinobacteria bacterium]|nr:MAG: CDGSH iron-sulfur domain-containing protein [Actinomycetota bacterium]